MQLGRGKYVLSLKPALAFGILLSLTVGMLCYYLTLRTIDTENEERFRNMARTAQYTINARISSYTNVLRAAASLFRADPDITEEKFHRFYVALNLPENYPAIESLNFLTALTDKNRDAFEARMRSEQLNDGEPPFQIRPAGRRPTYSVITFVEPREFWSSTRGLDLDMQPIHLKSLAAGRDSGLLSASGTPVKVMKDRKKLGLAMRIPVYRVGMPVDTVQQRRAAHLGSVGIAFSVKRLVHGVLDELPLQTVRLTLYNHLETLGSTAPTPAQIIYDSSANELEALPQGLDDPTRFHVELPVDFNGRKWNAHFSTPKEAVRRNSDTSFPWLALLAGSATTMLLYGLFYTLTSSRRRALELAKEMTKELLESQQQLLLSHQKLRQLAAHAEDIKENERKRIAREIHDDLGQNLLALRIDVQLLFSRTREHHPRLNSRVAATLAQIDATIKSVRQIINDLRPNVLDLGLNAAVSWQVDEFRRRTGIQCDLVEYHDEIVVDDSCATALFRILQESLTNVRRHSNATWVRVDLRLNAGSVLMSIRDNGVGLMLGQHKPGKFGLIGIEERVTMLGGNFSLSNAPGGGTVIAVALPVQSEKSHSGEEKFLPHQHEQLHDELA